MALPAVAAANLVVNGDFEAGNLSGWHVSNDPPDSGNWFAYSGTEIPEEPMATPQPPPQGEFAASTAQGDPGQHILYQDVALGDGAHELSLEAYFQSFAPLSSPPTLDWTVEPNQQYRIDVLKAGVPLTTLDPADILATLLHTEEGEIPAMGPTTLTADLSAFAGQTVRLRLTEVDNQLYFYAGVDAVSISGSAPPPPPPPVTPVASPSPPPPPSNAFTFGKLKLNKKKGTAKLQVNVPGAGSLTATDAKKKGKRIRKATATATAAGTATLILKPTASGMKTLKAKGKLAFKALVTFTPTGGTAASQSRNGKLKLTLPG
ncbi:MAG TPA: hypothetical protein VFJ76_10305 [Solirubrobacterales bacterium]|nr:hypothetical protein [Solirubrobacterales bacterium]